MHFCFYEGTGEEWSRELAMNLITLLDEFGVEPVSVSDEAVVNDTSDFLLSRYIKEHKYVVIIVSQKLFTDIYALVELDIIKKLYKKGEITVFSIYDGKHIPVLPERAEWINESWKIPINRMEDIGTATGIIMEKIMKDKFIENITTNMVDNISASRNMSKA